MRSRGGGGPGGGGGGGGGGGLGVGWAVAVGGHAAGSSIASTRHPVKVNRGMKDERRGRKRGGEVIMTSHTRQIARTNIKWF